MKIKSIGNNISAILKEKKMTQEDLSKVTGLADNYICRIISGAIVNVKIGTAKKIALALDKSIEDVFIIEIETK